MRGIVARASRYWPNVSHCQSMPSCSAVPGMSSTASMTSIRKSSEPGRTGAKPTPQLPMTAVVTPWCADGAISASQTACPS